MHAAGNGRLTFRDGSYYEGSWEEGKRLHGKWLSPDKKSEYQGEWADDKRHGTGTLHVQGLLQYTGQLHLANFINSVFYVYKAGLSPDVCAAAMPPVPSLSKFMQWKFEASSCRRMARRPAAWAGQVSLVRWLPLRWTMEQRTQVCYLHVFKQALNPSDSPPAQDLLPPLP